eukprot:GHUV01028730.1.p1 GENE.GHUV01028730.1~~GHUV01028730.1.p1  ORF type:complete len:153 (-),score=21.04 GHUV01028730.1:520-978(-)
MSPAMPWCINGKRIGQFLRGCRAPARRSSASLLVRSFSRACSSASFLATAASLDAMSFTAAGLLRFTVGLLNTVLKVLLLLLPAVCVAAAGVICAVGADGTAVETVLAVSATELSDAEALMRPPSPAVCHCGCCCFGVAQAPTEPHPPAPTQ